MKNTLKKYITCIVLCSLLLCSNISSIQAISFSNIASLSVNFSNNSSDVTVHSETFNDNGYQLQVEGNNDTSYVYLHSEIQSNWSSYGALYLRITNTSQEELSFSLHMSTEDNDDIFSSINTNYLIKMTGISEFSCMQTTSGMLSIPAGFDGELVVFFSNLENIQNDTFTNVYSWGISLPVGKSEVSFNVLQAGLLSNDQLSEYEKTTQFALVGADFVNKPLNGTSIEEYEVETSVENTIVTYQIASYAQGVSIDENSGILTVEPEANLGSITIAASIDDLIIYKEVEINNLLESNPTSMFIKSIKDFEILGNLNAVLSVNNYVLSIRYILIVIGVGILCFYFFWNKKIKNRR